MTTPRLMDTREILSLGMGNRTYVAKTYSNRRQYLIDPEGDVVRKVIITHTHYELLFNEHADDWVPPKPSLATRFVLLLTKLLP